ncbi:MAG: hypothetical protein ACIAXF_08685 [Phycisphaerales bacterium JB063]
MTPPSHNAVGRAAKLLSELNPATNPLVMRGIRTRLRPQAMLSAALITITISGFLYTMVYITTVNNTQMPEDVTPVQQEHLVRAAAKSAMMPLIFLQGIILMVLGTGAAAGGIARERSDRLLDYHRVSPMPPHAKILGLLFGLPIREYFMFALTLPFVGYAAYKGHVPLFALLQFYVVFISSVWLYHLTGMVSGMIVDRPWRAGFVVQGLVIGLYVGLPQLSAFGLTSFEYLTARPAFYGIVQQHLLTDWSEIGSMGEGWRQAREQLRILRWKSVAFFNLKMHPLVFSLMVQSFVLAILYTVIHRKWLGESRLALSKPTGLVFFALLQLFVLGSLLGLLWDAASFTEMVKSGGNIANAVSRGEQWVAWRFAFAALAVSGIAGTILLHIITPTWHQQVNALRKARKRGRARLPLLSDAASPWPVALGVIAMSAVAYMFIVREIGHAGVLDDGPHMSAAWGGVLFLSLALCTVFLLREQVGAKPFTMAMFLFWVVPFLAWAILYFGLRREVLAVFICLPCPVTTIYLFTVLLVHDPDSGAKAWDMMPDEIGGVAQLMGVLGILGYFAVTVALAIAWFFRRRRLLRSAQVERAANGSPEPHPESPLRPAAD